MEISRFAIEGPLLIVPRQHSDSRGVFSETFREDSFERAAGPVRFIQDNHSRSVKRGTVRGLHFQIAPSPQAKLVRCVKGAILDVAVDLRRSSPTYGRHVSAVLSADNWAQLYVPVGFAHGFCTTEDDSEVIYKVSAYYDPGADKGLAWDDPDLAIAWTVTGDAAVLSDKDRRHPRLAELPAWFD